MEIVNPYIEIIAISLVIIISYFFNVISQKTNIPSVLLLIALGILMKQGLELMGVNTGNQLFNVLELLGIIGLIMIVLEASLDLKLTKDKWPTIWKSFSVALLSLLLSTGLIAGILKFFIIEDFFTCLVYAVPLSIMSSAIIIPSVGGLEDDKKEFMVYEGTFSDILGIMVFYFLIGNAGAENAKVVAFDVVSNISLTIILSIVISYGLVLVFERMNSQVKLFLLIAVLLILYSVGKLFHLSSLLIILIFGLVLNNNRLFFQGFLRKWSNPEKAKKVLHDFHLVTIESAFVVRTFFFVLFGISISLASLVNFEVGIISLSILIALYLIRFLMIRLFLRGETNTLIWLAPRGLITILLFYAIPDEYKTEAFDTGILLYTIIISCILMAVALVTGGKRVIPVESMDLIQMTDGTDGEEEELDLGSQKTTVNEAQFVTEIPPVEEEEEEKDQTD